VEAGPGTGGGGTADERAQHRLDEFEAHRSRLFGVAYRMLGSRAEAEDVVQEAYLRWHRAERGDIRTPAAWLVTTTARLAIDRLRALQARRETYVGPWLPEPLLGVAPSADREVELASDLSMAFLVLLERLAPEERAAFLLHDVFDCGYPQVAEAIGKSEAACRQMVHRARERVRTDRQRFRATERARVRLVERFQAAVASRDEQALLALFAPDATWTADGGGRVPAGRKAIAGAPRIVRLVLGVERLVETHAPEHRVVFVNGETGLLLYLDGALLSVMSFATDGERILAVHNVLNPEKLSRGVALPPRLV
jgi:RNA polymerase sigma-70 factor (ECF subfamily)